MARYMLEAKNVVKNLATIGDPISERNLLFYVLRGLGPKYNNFVSIIKVREVFPSMNVVHNYLEVYDKMLQRQSPTEYDHFMQMWLNFKVRVLILGS